MNRREFVTRSTAAAGSAVLSPSALFAKDDKTAGKSCKGQYKNPLPRWRGFNLMAFFAARADNPQYCDQILKTNELDWIRDWGFDYIRLPIDYWMFVDSDWATTNQMDITRIRSMNEVAYERLDKAVEQCIVRGLHMTINMHRCPGYCINGWESEPYNLFKDAQAEDDFEYHWQVLANRYKGISAEKLSFNLLNEAPDIGEKMSGRDYDRVIKRVLRTIHGISPDRLVIADGSDVGREVLPGLIDEPLAQAVHAYNPHEVSHYKASWTPMYIDIDPPTWPAKLLSGNTYDRRHLELYFARWGELVRQGVGVHCGETGCYNHTPHDVFLSWFTDVMDILKGYDIGYAMWNFSGDFGVLNSGRKDVAYEDWYGYKLDRKLLDLLLKY
jgi:endoglucanase